MNVQDLGAMRRDSMHVSRAYIARTLASREAGQWWRQYASREFTLEFRAALEDLIGEPIGETAGPHGPGGTGVE